jgi:two-component system, sensor histidine kinase PdtaS
MSDIGVRVSPRSKPDLGSGSPSARKIAGYGFRTEKLGFHEGPAMGSQSTRPDVGHSLALAMVASSRAPLLLLDEALSVIAASKSFCRTFEIDPASISNTPIFGLGSGEWDLPRLRSLLNATLSGHGVADSYEMDLNRNSHNPRRLVLNVHKLEYGDGEQVRLLLTISDVTDARISEKLKDDLLRDKTILLQEVQHRVANSLQIIASVLLQSAFTVNSEETRGHLHDAHNRVMSIAAVQRQLALSADREVILQTYLSQLCQSLGASMIRDHKQFSLIVTTDKSVVGADVSVSLGLIVTELVINALKHAFPWATAGRIEVDYRSDGPDWKLSVNDNGVGITSGPDQAKPKAGLGTSIVEALARQLDAEITISDTNPGTGVTIAHTHVAGRVEPSTAKRAV